MAKLNMMVLGCGRIGKMHIECLLRHFSDRVNVRAVVDRCVDQRWLDQYNLQAVAAEAFDDAVVRFDVDVFLIAASSSEHVGLIERCLPYKKPIFCEKPVSFDSAKILQLHQEVGRHQIQVQVGLNRRFDPDFDLLRKRYQSGEIGHAQLIQLTNRDPKRPSLDFVQRSGGLFLDFNVHDFDMLHFITGEPIASVQAMGAALVDPAIAELDDIDTAIINVTMSSGTLAVIDCSRETQYGYDQRIEIHGAKGDLMVKNHYQDQLQQRSVSGATLACIEYSFVERYRDSYRLQMTAFLDAVSNQANVAVGLLDVARAVDAAIKAGASLNGAPQLEPALEL